MEWIFLVLIAVVLVFGFGVVVLNRVRAGKALPPARTAPTPVARPPREVRPAPAPAPTAPTPEQLDDELTEPAVIAHDEAELAAAIEVDEAPGEPEVVERATFRSRMGKARSALTGAFLGIRGRAGITDATWEDLE